MSDDVDTKEYERLSIFEAIALIERPDKDSFWRHRNSGKTVDYDLSLFSTLEEFKNHIRTGE